MVDHKEALANISFYAGNRFDLVQAGGGNTSVKINKKIMLVKASGIHLSEVTKESGYVSIDYSMIREYLSNNDLSSFDKQKRQDAANILMQESKLSLVGQPSIETFLHALLSKHTLHTHPISVNILAAKTSWKKELLNAWPDAICIPYHTPGIDLANALLNELNIYIKDHHGRYPKVVFLQNHGLIVSSESHEEVIDITEKLTAKIDSILSLDLQRYRNITALQKILNQMTTNNINIICNDDELINQYLHSEVPSLEVWPFCPDTLIYCGVRPVFLKNLDSAEPIREYVAAYKEYPKVIILNKQVYFCAANFKKAKEAQDLFKFHLIVTQHSQKDVQRLTLSEVAYLSNWDAEKYRQEV